MPKLKLGEINLYLVEIFLLVFFPLLFPFIRLKFQRIVLAMWGIVLVSTIYSFIYVIEKCNRMLQPPVYAKKLYIFLELSTS